MSDRRKKHVNLVFEVLDKEHSNSLSIEEIDFHIPDEVLYDQKLVNGDRKCMLEYFFNLFDKNQSGQITFDEWFSFYDDVSAQTTSCDVFCALLTKTWGVPEQDCSPIKDSYVRGLIERLREKLYNRTYGVKEEFVLKKIYEDFDIDRIHDKQRCFNRQQLQQLFTKLGIPLCNRY